jgi:UDP-N-acetyl-D-mannosaminuronic acid transferase (WecB/TagA/CpsF family)
MVVTLVSPVIDSALTAFVNSLIEKKKELASERRPVRVAWLNHYSIRLALRDSAPALAAMDVCGVDGQLLKWLLRHPVRTSADLVVPLVLKCDDTIDTVLAVGGPDGRAAALEAAFSELAGRPLRVHAVDGYEGLRRGADLERLVAEIQPDLLLVGLGAGLQEQVLLEAAAGMTGGYALTCGGFLDQVLQGGYYPSWAYPLRLNWLVRLAREPRRLWRRYTTQAFLALFRAGGWRRSMVGIPGLPMHVRMCVWEPVPRHLP